MTTKTEQQFLSSPYCTTRKFCHLCRRDRAWRQRMNAPNHCPYQAITGMGDLVERVALPVAKFIDRVAGTDLQNCGGCEERRDDLNKLT
jgi:hypothetical protein